MGPRFSIIASTIVLAAVTLFAQRTTDTHSGARTLSQTTSLGGFVGTAVDEVEGPAPVARPLTAPAPQRPSIGAAPATAPPYPFFPQAGTLWQDLFVSNFVDLNSGSGILDYECSGYTYDGHTGHDAVIVGFREQAIGVPVFAALDGTVVAAQDGRPDEEVTNLVGRPANFVVLSHTGGYRTWYYHFKRGSVAVAAGQTVAAGTQLGLTGSSGNSSWPHLHFESVLNNTSFEPNAGACRSGSTYWQNQTSIRRDIFVDSFTFGTAEFSGSAGLPYDQVTRRGTLVTGTSTLYFRFSIHNLPIQSTYRIVISRPDGTVANDTTQSFGNTELGRQWWYGFYWNVPVTTTGTWNLDMYVNGTRVITAPYLAVSSSGQIVNRAPLAVSSVAIDPAAPGTSDVPFCRVTPSSLYRRDADYDLVRYRFVWTVNGAIVRDVTNAALADAIPRGTAPAGSTIVCTVTPSDDTTTGPVSSATATVAGSAPPPVTLSAPTNMTATASGSSVTLSWTAPTGTVTSYIIEAGSAPGLSDLANFSTGTTAPTYSASGVGRGTYYVRVRAVGAAGTSAASNEATLVVGPAGGCTAAPGAPGSLAASVSGTTLTLTWSAASGTPSSYVIEAGTGPARTDIVANMDLGSAATSFAAGGVARGTYYIRLRAKNACGTGSVSNEIVVSVP